MRKSILRFVIAILVLGLASAAFFRHWETLSRADGSGSDPATPASPAYMGKLRYLALGDSYTIGERVPADQRWPMQLAKRMRKDGFDLSDPLIIARTGWTTDDLLGAIDRVKLTDKFDLVTLLIGVNNQFQGRSEDEYRQQFAQLLTEAIAFADKKAGHVVVLSIPDWGATPFGQQYDSKKIGAEIDRFNAINRQETAKVGVRYVDITPQSRSVATQPDLVADDGLHPSRKEYDAWVDATLDTARKALAVH
jgi:lysophospholipase L1-like esterase